MPDKGLEDKDLNKGNKRDWPDLAGCLHEDTHVLPVRVYYEDTDFSGLVYHATYIRWCERGRTVFVRLIGLNQKELFEQNESQDQRFFVVRKMQLDYLKPALMDDVIDVVTKVKEIGAATVVLSQEIQRDGEALFRAEVMIVLMSAQGRPVRLSDAMKGAFLPSGE